MGASGIECLLVADAEAYHAWIAQVHILYLLEVGLLPGVEVFLGTGGSGTGHQIDEAVGVGVYFADAGFAGFGGNEHDDTDVILRGDGFVTLFVIAEREVGNDDAIDAAFHALLAEGFEAELHDGIEVSHKDKRDADIATDVAQLFEKQAEGHAVVQGAGGGVLNDNAVGHGVTERNSDFNHADSVSFEGTDNVGCTVEGGTACTKVNGQQILGAVLEKLVNAVQHTISIYNFTIYNLLFGCAIYAACYDLQFYNLLFTIYHVQCTICHVAYIAQPNSK